MINGLVLQIPFAVSNTITERTVQKDLRHTDATATTGTQQQSVNKMNIFYFQFWYFLFVFLTACLFFWVDLLPRFGTSRSWHVFTER